MQNPYGGPRVPAQTDNSTRRRTGHLHLNTSCETLAMPDTAPLTADFHRVEVHPPAAPFTGLGTLAVGVITIAALYFGREVFVPMALALLMSFALGPPVVLLRRWHINRVLAVIGVVILVFALILGIGALIGGQLAQLAEN